MQPTDEQVVARDACLAGRNIILEAGAGTGKTSTCQLIAEAFTARGNGRGLYAAFNRSVKDEARERFPTTVHCATSHGLAFARFGKPLAHKLPGPQGRPAMKLSELAAHLEVQAVQLDPVGGGHGVWIQPERLAWSAQRAIDRFCRSADPTLTIRHIGKDALPDTVHRGQYDAAVLAVAVSLWQEMTDPDAPLRTTHDAYRKLWALSEPKLRFDWFMLDEAQDTAPVVAAVLLAQDHMQKIAVGDSCQPSGTLVTVVDQPGRGGRWTGPRPTTVRQVPVEQVQTGDLVVSYHIPSGYLHRNGKRVLGISSREFTGDLVVITERSGLRSEYTPNHHCVARFGEDITDKFVVYLMAKNDNYRVGVTGGRLASQGRTLGLSLRANAEKADAAWILSVHDTRAEAVEAEAIAAWAFGVPDVMFRSAGHAMTAEGVARFWEKLGGNRDQASALLDYHGRDIRFPLWEKGRSLQIRRPFITRACNLIDGMEVLPLASAMLADGHTVTRSAWSPINVSTRFYHGRVWSMTVEDNHTYVGDGILTHNCQQLYKWAGAVDAMANWPGATRHYLTQSWRFGQAIADEANKWLSLLATPLRLTGNPGLDSTLAELSMDTADAVLCRTNVGAMGAVLTGLAAEMPVALVGGGREIESLAWAGKKLMAGQRTTHPELCVFDTWDEVRRAAAGEEADGALRVFVAVMERFGPDAVIEAMRSLVPERAAQIVVSTGHKAKGRQWPRVMAASDFAPKTVEGTDEVALPDSETTMLAYVTATRAQQVLDRGPLTYVDDFATPEVNA